MGDNIDTFCRSDETNCGLVDFPTYGSNKDIPPNQRIENGFGNVTFPPLEIQTNVTVVDILDLSDETSSFSVIFIIDLEWNDLNLKFKYLKEESQSNSIDKETFEQRMWKPQLNFGTLAGTAEHPKVVFEEIVVIRSHKATLANDIDQVFYNESYLGSENKIHSKRIYQATFNCQFNGIYLYPFGTNECHFRFFLKGASNKMTTFKLLPLNYLAGSVVGEFNVNGITMEESYQRGLHNAVVSIEVLRSRLSIILVTYLPTILMNLINQVTFCLTNHNAICILRLQYI